MVSTLSINTSSPSWWSFELDQLSHSTDNGVATSMTEFSSYETNTSPSSTFDANMENQNYSPNNPSYGFVNNALITDGTSTFRISDLENAYINQVTYADGTTTTASNQLFYTYTLTDLDTGETSFHVVPGDNSATSNALQADIEDHGNIVSFGPVTSQSSIDTTYVLNNPDADLQAITDSGVAVVDGFGTGGYDTPTNYVSSEAIAPDSNFFLLEVAANETQSAIDTIRANEFSQLGSGGTGAQADSLAMNEEIYNQTTGNYEQVVDPSGGGLWSVEQLTFADGTVVNYPGGSDNIRAARVETIDLNTGESHYYYSVYDDGNSTLLADLAAAHGPITNVDIGDGIGGLGSGDAAISRDIELDTSVVPNGIVDGEETGEVMGIGYNDAGQATDGGGDIIDGADGDNDSIRGNGGDDSITAGAGNDTVDGGADNDTIDGGAGNDEIYGGTGNDSLSGGLGSDTLDGGDGNDVLNTAQLGTGSVTDEAYGGAGNDTVYGYYGDDTYDGGAGTDQISYDNLNAASAVNLNLGAGTATLANGDVQTVTNFENAVGTFGSDTITGTGGDNILDGGPGSGDDTLYGRGGDDTLLGGAGNDSLLGGTGDDSIDGGAGNDRIFGDETVAIDRGELITNGTFTGNLNGWTSIDGNGDGTAPYNAGDTASFNSSGTPAGDSIEQEFTSAVGIEHTITLDLIENNSGVSTQTFQIEILDSDGTVVATETHTVANNSTENVSFTFTPTSDNSTLRITNTAVSNTGASDGKVDNVSITATGPDTRTYNDTIDGGAGDDTLYGQDGDDTLDGGADNDRLYGGVGDDSLNGGTGNDHLFGQDGADTLDGGAGDDYVRGGQGSDTMTGGDGNDYFRVYEAGGAGTGHDIITDFGTGNTGPIDDGITTNNDYVHLSDFYNQANYDAAVLAGDIDPAVIKNPLQWLRADHDDDGILNDTGAGWDANNTVTIQNGGSAIDSSGLTFDTTSVVCFAAGTMIQTQMGEVAVEDLRQGDMVLTRDRGFQPLRWVGGNKVSIEVLSENANLRPIRIKAGALGSNLPQQDLLVSPQHRVLVSSKIVEKMFDGEAEVLIAAKQLVMIDGIDVADDVDSVEYFHFLFDQHEIVFSNGAETESLFTGPEALKAVSPEARTEILTLFPELSSIDYAATACRTIVKGRKGRQLAVRHKNNNKQLLELH